MKSNGVKTEGQTSKIKADRADIMAQKARYLAYVQYFRELSARKGCENV